MEKWVGVLVAILSYLAYKRLAQWKIGDRSVYLHLVIAVILVVGFMMLERRHPGTLTSFPKRVISTFILISAAEVIEVGIRRIVKSTRHRWLPTVLAAVIAGILTMPLLGY